MKINEQFAAGRAVGRLHSFALEVLEGGMLLGGMGLRDPRGVAEVLPPRCLPPFYIPCQHHALQH